MQHSDIFYIDHTRQLTETEKAREAFAYFVMAPKLVEVPIEDWDKFMVSVIGEMQ